MRKWPWAKPCVGSGVESFPQPGAAPSPVSGICAVGKVFVAALADRITAASQKVGKSKAWRRCGFIGGERATRRRDSRLDKRGARAGSDQRRD